MLSITISLIIFILIALVIHIAYSPALDITREGKILLWYGRTERKFIVLKK
jgi:hypothetical protein